MRRADGLRKWNWSGTLRVDDRSGNETMNPILDHPIISARYFFPRPGAPPNGVTVEVEGARLACALLELDPSWPTLVHFHGNGEVVADYVPDWEPLLRHWRVNGFFAEYRGYGGSTGTPQLGAMLGDWEAIADAVGVPPERTLVFGRSVGSIYAIEYVHRVCDVATLVLESGIHDVAERLLLRMQPRELGTSEDELRAEVLAAMNHGEKLAGYGGRLLVLHAEHDSLVGVSHGQRNFDAATRASTKELKRFPQGDHNNILWANTQAYVAAVKKVIDETWGEGR